MNRWTASTTRCISTGTSAVFVEPRSSKEGGRLEQDARAVKESIQVPAVAVDPHAQLAGRICKVAVSRDHVGRRLCTKGHRHFLKRSFQEKVIRVQESTDLARRRGEALVQCVGGARIGFRDPVRDPRRVPQDGIRTPIGRTAIGDDELKLWIACRSTDLIACSINSA